MPNRGKRPSHQPAGWNKAVRRMLKLEHVERLSDTQVRITLPPCPDFDIEEDETVEVWIPAAALKNSDRPLYAGSITIKADSYWQRIDNAIQALKEERSGLGPETAVSDFLLTYFACEIVAKSIVSGSKHTASGRKSLQKQVTTRDICRALAKLQVNLNRSSVDALFSLEQSLASDMSARRLRDKIVHGMKPQYRSAVRHRYTSLMAKMIAFLNAIEMWRETCRGGETDRGGPTSV